MPTLKRLPMLLATCAITGLFVAGCAQNSDPAMATTTTAATAAVAGPNLMADLTKDVAGVEKKLVALANAMPENSMNWRPMPGVRSVREVFLHVSGENYLIPTFMGATIPADVGINAADMTTVATYEHQDISKQQTVADLEASFANIKKAMAADSALTLGAEVDFFGTKESRQAAWLGTVTHLHEHLGQAIAYARMNKIVPPWSK